MSWLIINNFKIIIKLGKDKLSVGYHLFVNFSIILFIGVVLATIISNIYVTQK